MKPGRKKLTDAQVREMLDRRKGGELLKVLADDFGITLNWVCQLCNHTRRHRRMIS